MSLSALAAALAALGIALWDRGGPPAPAPPVEPAPGASARVDVAEPSPPSAPPAPGSTAEVVARCLPAVVNISSRRVTAGVEGPTGNPFFDLLRPFLGGGGPREAQSLGSGVIVDPAGVVLTNHHVVADATEIRVTLSDGRELAARAVGGDPESDVAVLRIEVEPGVRLRALPYGDSTALRQGDPVLAIGNPFGVGQTVTMGIVSATGRASMGINDYEDFIQTDAAINPGNSGGALVDARGELVGINTAILSRTGGSHGIGFAIPSSMARPIAEALLRDGRVTRGWLGVSLSDLTPQLARSLGLAPDTRGVALMDVEPAGPAAEADLRRGDRIVRLDSETIRSSRQLRTLLATRGAGSTVRLTRARAGREDVVAVTLAERPAPRAEAAPASEAAGASEIAGLTLAPLSDALRSRYGIAASARGLVVVATGSGPGPSAGIATGDVIVEVAGQPVESTAQFRQLYEGSFLVAMVRVERGGSSRIVLVGR
ncbi:MAG: Do family serine endopeptidase [Sandaracinaceae bacterium]|nr:Do family serine endopeptidase [Sandaracinaceae bacterium]